MNDNKKVIKKDPSQEKIKFIVELFNSKKLTEAKTEIDKQLIIYPKSSYLFNILGAIYSTQNKMQEALASYNQSIKNNPKYAQAYNNLGICMYKIGKITEAIKHYNKSIELQNNNADAHNNLGAALKELGENEKSISSYKRAIEIQPNHADAHNNLGAALKELGENEKSINHYEKSIKINPNSPIAYSNIGNVYKSQGNYDKAIIWHQKAIKINSRYADAYFNLGKVYEEINEFQKAKDFFLKAVKIEPSHVSANTNLLFNTCWSNNNQEYLEIAKKYYTEIPRHYDKEIIKNKSNNKRAIKVGFVSGDFRDHSVVFFLLETLKYLKKKEIQLFAYSNNSKEDKFTNLIKQYFHNWKLIVYKTHKEVINSIRKDEVDILFDLSGHTSHNRLPIFKSRCAPVQVSWCGWLASTGIKEIDYIVGDKYATPLLDQNKFSEKIYQLNKIWQCSSISNLELKIPLVKKNSKTNIMFGSFVNAMKININVINVWSKILKNLPESKLLLRSQNFDNQKIKQKFINEFNNNKVNKNQIIYEGVSTRENYLDSYNKLDMVLDTFPVGNATGAFDASFMGVPILTKINNNSFWFRTGESVNKNLNMNDWIAVDEEDYIKKAINFSQNKKYLNSLKDELRNRAINSSLFDSKSYSNDFYEMLMNIKK